MARGRDEVTIKDVARVAGLGLGTVSRVLNNKPHVNEKSRKRVLAAIEQLGYSPDLVARSMRAGESKTLAFVVRDFTGAILSALADAVQGEIDPLGFSLFVASSYHDPERELALIRRFKARRVDGLIIATSSEADPAVLSEFADGSMPLVLLDRELPEALDAVQVDHAGGAAQAVDHLVSLGHRRIALISGEPDVFPTTERVRGYREALARHGIRHRPALCRVGSFSVDFAYQQAFALLGSKQRPTAIVAGGTAMLPGVLRAAQELELVIPRDVSVVGGADGDLARYSTPPLTVVTWDYAELGRTAGRFLANRLEDPDGPRQRRLFPTRLVPRQSCAPPPDDP
ncbi:LacI family transcriptional regulator [Lichenibacterium ramalinae]|uniref:LacI family transcriptional regulator n=1 Tax=Lichenibacterium ramalinae TaxID=2316527 RepID=A0A4Q2R701_9HYPH|nr:LacI family transcriptional regulator [Lichenibacterium ramalinae]